MRWLLQKDVTASVIIGATSFAQLDDNMGAANGWSLSKEEVGDNHTFVLPPILFYQLCRKRRICILNLSEMETIERWVSD